MLFIAFSLVRNMQPRRSGPKEGENVIAARDPGPGNGHSKLPARHEP
jgi:hypothetical protein